MASANSDITDLVARWSAGDELAFDALIEAAYPELRVLAHHQLRIARGDATVSTTVLVHEVYLKLAGTRELEWPDRSRFFAFCAKAMRHILVDAARRRAAQKRGGGWTSVGLGDEAIAAESESLELLALNEALDQLAARSRRMADIVECRFFAGMSVTETAEALSTSPRTVEREWTRARAYLQRALGTSVESPLGGCGSA